MSLKKHSYLTDLYFIYLHFVFFLNKKAVRFFSIFKIIWDAKSYIFIRADVFNKTHLFDRNILINFLIVFHLSFNVKHNHIITVSIQNCIILAPFLSK